MPPDDLRDTLFVKRCSGAGGHRFTATFHARFDRQSSIPRAEYDDDVEALATMLSARQTTQGLRRRQFRRASAHRVRVSLRLDPMMVLMDVEDVGVDHVGSLKDHLDRHLMSLAPTGVTGIGPSVSDTGD
jgi:hypothetical protein